MQDLQNLFQPYKAIRKFNKTDFSNDKALKNINVSELNIIMDIYYAARGLQSEFALLNKIFKLENPTETFPLLMSTKSYLHDAFWKIIFKTPERNLQKDLLWQKYPKFMNGIKERITRITKIRFRFVRMIMDGPDNDLDFYAIRMVCFGLTPITVAKVFYMQDNMILNNATIEEGSFLLKLFVTFLGLNFQNKISNHIFGTKNLHDVGLWNDMVDKYQSTNNGDTYARFFIEANEAFGKEANRDDNLIWIFILSKIAKFDLRGFELTKLNPLIKTLIVEYPKGEDALFTTDLKHLAMDYASGTGFDDYLPDSVNNCFNSVFDDVGAALNFAQREFFTTNSK